MTPLPQDIPFAATRALSERRSSRRRRLCLSVQVWPEAAGLPPDGEAYCCPRRVVLRDLSASGLFLFSAKPLRAGMLIWIRARWGRQTHYLKGVVRHSSWQRVSGHWMHGCGVQFHRCPQTARFVTAASVLLGPDADS